MVTLVADHLGIQGRPASDCEGHPRSAEGHEDMTGQRTPLNVDARLRREGQGWLEALDRETHSAKEMDSVGVVPEPLSLGTESRRGEELPSLVDYYEEHVTVTMRGKSRGTFPLRR